MSKKTKEWGPDDMLLAIDPASHSAGLALFTLQDNAFIDAKTLTAQKGEWPERLFSMQMQAAEFLEAYEGNIKVIVTELIPSVADPTVHSCIGALASCLPFKAKINRNTFLSPSTWKAFARRQGAIPQPGAKRQDVKGIKAIHDMLGKDFHNFDSDDAADATIMGICWLMTKK